MKRIISTAVMTVMTTTLIAGLSGTAHASPKTSKNKSYLHNNVSAITCSNIIVYGIRGSGQVSSARKGTGVGTHGFGAQNNAVKGALEKQINGLKKKPTISYYYNAYKAVDVKSKAAITGSAYSEAVIEGANIGGADLSAIANKCGTKSKVIVIGYSQGAQVAHGLAHMASRNAKDAAATKVRNMVKQWVLVADPAHQRGAANVTAEYFGGKPGNGIVFQKKTPWALGSNVKGKVYTYCQGADYVCSGNGWKAATYQKNHVDYYKQTKVATKVATNIFKAVK